MSEYGSQQLLEQFVIPELREIKRLLGTKADDRDLDELRKDFQQHRREFEEFRRAALSPERVGTLIGDALQRKEARAWTTTERLSGLILVSIAAATLILSIYNATH